MPKANLSQVKKFEPMSVARIYALLAGIVGVVSLVIIAIVSAFGGVAGLGVGIAIGIIFLVVALIAGFVGGFIEALVYNAVAGAVGGVRIGIDKNGLISKVDPMSFAKIAFVINVIVLAIVAVFLLGALMKGFGLSSTHYSAAIIAVFFVALVVLDGFVIPYLEAWLYNDFAARIGGIKVTLKNGVLNRVEPMAYAKIAAAIAFVIVIVQQVITFIAELISGTASPLIIVTALLSAVLGVIAAFVVAAVIAVLYNYLAGRFGGIKLVIGK